MAAVSADADFHSHDTADCVENADTNTNAPGFNSFRAQVYSPNEDSDDDEDDLVDPTFLSMLEDEDNDMDVNENAEPWHRRANEPLDTIDFYSILGVPRDASLAEIRASYKRLSRLLHPDKHASIHPTLSTVLDSSLPSKTEQPVSNSYADAQAAFGKVAAAYAILSDVNKRAIYDQYGYNGLKMEGWQLALREKSPAELRLEWLRLRAEYREEQRLRLTQPVSELSLGVDMTDLFDRYLKELPSERQYAPQFSVYEMILRQSVTIGASLRTQVGISGEVMAHNGLGVGTWLALIRHQLPASSWPFGSANIDTEFSYGRGGQGLGLSVRIGRQIGERVSCHVGANVIRNQLDRSNLSLMLGLGAGISCQLAPRLHASLQLSGYGKQGFSSDIVWEPEAGAAHHLTLRLSGYLRPLGHHGFALHVERSLAVAWLSAPVIGTEPGDEADTVRSSGGGDASAGRDESSAYGRPGSGMDEEGSDENVFGAGGRGNEANDKKGHVAVNLGVNTVDLVLVGVTLTCPISRYSKLSWGINVSIGRGISIRLGLQRGTQSFVVPIRLSDGQQQASENDSLVDPAALGYGCLVPLLLFAVLRSTVYEPWLWRKLQRAQTARRHRLRAELSRRRQAALATQALMQLAAARQRRSEAAIGGLVIERAVYGCLAGSILSSNTTRDPVSELDLSGPISVDVTTPLQALVEKSQLRLPPGRWSDQQGFYDPCLGLSLMPGAGITQLHGCGPINSTGENGFRSNPSAAGASRTDTGGGIPRQLFVRYLFRGALHQVCVDESQGLAMPLAKHKLLTTD